MFQVSLYGFYEYGEGVVVDYMRQIVKTQVENRVIDELQNMWDESKIKKPLPVIDHQTRRTPKFSLVFSL